MVSEVRMTSYHRFLSRAFSGEYKVNLKVNEFDSVERVFDKSKSVFKEWKEDKPAKIAEGMQQEIALWNVPKIVKEEDEVIEIIKYLMKKAVFLKTRFLIRASSSNFPVVRNLQYQ